MMKGRKWIQRVAAAVLTAAMCLTQGSFGDFFGSMEVKAATGTLTDGTFSDGDSFESNWNPQVQSWDNYSTIWQTNGYLNIYNGTASTNTMSIAQTVTMQAGVYQISLDIKGKTETSGLYLIVKTGDDTQLENMAVDATSTENYTTIHSGCFEIKEEKEVTISLGGDVASGYWANVDNIGITKLSINSVDAIVDGEFSDGDKYQENWHPSVASWENWSTFWQKDGYLNVYNGTASTNAMSIYQTVTLQPGDYKVSMDLKGMMIDSGLKLEVKAGESALVDSLAILAASDSEYTTVDTQFFTIGEATEVTISLGGDVVSGYWANIDNIALYKASVNEPAGYSQLCALLETVPDNYATAGFTSSSVDALNTAETNARACTADTDASTIDACYAALDAALKALVYEDATIYVKKIDNMREDFIKGIDISSYISEKNSGVVYRDWDGQPVEGKDFIKLFAAEGVNYIRLRVWNDPKTESGVYYGGGNNDLNTTVDICNIINEYNTTPGYGDTYGEVKVLVDIQYSDFWADPDKQAAPKAWKNMTLDEKTVAVAEFTDMVLTQVAQTGVDIGMVQIGNETNTGICGESIPEYKTENSTEEAKEALANTGYIKIFKAGCDAVDAYNTANGTDIKKVVHFTDPHNAGTFFAQILLDGGVNYDVYATSYYPYWHGTTDNLQSMLTQISELKNADGNNIEVMVAETQYVYTNDDYDGADNQAYEGKNNIDLSAWPVSVQGQANEIRDVFAAVAGVGEYGIGAFYWEPCWLGVGNAYDENGELSESALAENKNKWETYGSGWATDAAAEYDTSAAVWGGGGTNNENASLFDFTGHPLASLHVLKYINYGAVATQKSYYNYEYGENKDSIIISAGLTAAEMKEKLEAGIAGVYIIYNDGSKGTDAVSIAWSESSLSELEQKIATNTAIGNSFLVKGTVTVDGVAHEVKASVNVEPAENLMKNGDFESTEGWTINPQSMIFQAAENARNASDGHKQCVAFKTYGSNVEGLTADENGCYQAVVSQQVTITEPGVYEGKVFFEGDNGTGARTGEKINVTVDYNDMTLTSNAIVLAGWMNWQCATVSEITITQEMIDKGNNVLLVSANLLLGRGEANSGTWGTMDDFYLYKISDIEDNQTDDSGDNKPADETKPDGDTSEQEEEVEKEILIGKDALVASLGNDGDYIEKIIFTENLFTAEELAAMNAGAKTKVVLAVNNINSTVSAEDKAKIEEVAKNAKVGMYLDLTLSAQIGTLQKTVEEIPDGKIAITVELTSDLINTDTTLNRSYGVVRIHDGVAEVLSDVTFDNGKLTFKTDKFSVYAIIYTDEPVLGSDNQQGGNQNQTITVTGNIIPQTTTSQNTDSQKVEAADTSDSSPILPAMLMILAAFGIFGIVVIRGRRKNSL